MSKQQQRRDRVNEITVLFEPLTEDEAGDPTLTDSQDHGCIWCGANEHEKHLMQCSSCKAVEYCGRECQKKHWKIHKLACKNITSQKASFNEGKAELNFPGHLEEWTIAHDTTCIWLLESALPDGKLSHILSLTMEYRPKEANPAARLRVLEGEVIPRHEVMARLESGGGDGCVDLFEELKREIYLVDRGRTESRMVLYSGEMPGTLQPFLSARAIRSDVGDDTRYLGLQKGNGKDMPWLETIKRMAEKGIVMKWSSIEA